MEYNAPSVSSVFDFRIYCELSITVRHISHRFLGSNRTGWTKAGQGSGWKYNAPSVLIVFDFGT